ncbi:hypothetical protein GTS_39510 [Gandjariella thermophila]|uniref:Uncharacterized protein n=1 Tax=Gandjariella thermophila TaxID=1931992 RepID=A0A4D4JCD3_9PSEU|nr:hypothetical protein GTS_39510 [Gandjariella thermophila]
MRWPAQPGHRRLDITADVLGPAGEAFQQHQAERVDVRGRADGLPAHLLGRQVTDRADQLVGRGEPVAAGEQGDAEVGEVGPPVRVQQDVRGFDVAVHHVPGVHVGQRVRDARAQ